MCLVFVLLSPHQINWLRVEEDVPPHAVVTGSDLYIANLNKSYNGTYRCVASNVVGEAYDDYTLYVHGMFYTWAHWCLQYYFLFTPFYFLDNIYEYVLNRNYAKYPSGRLCLLCVSLLYKSIYLGIICESTYWDGTESKTNVPRGTVGFFLYCIASFQYAVWILALIFREVLKQHGF